MLYVNDSARFKGGCVEPDQRRTLADRVATQLRELRDPDNRPVLKAVRTKEELYGSGGLETPPDLFLQSDAY